MRYSDRFCNWFIIQVIAIFMFCKGSALERTTATTQGCVGSRLELQCPTTKIIKVTNVYLGVSDCGGISCCIKDVGCSSEPSGEHVKFIRDKCDGQRNCTVEINSIDASPCESGWWWGKQTTNGDPFERITYSCSVSESRQNETDEKYGSEEESNQESNQESKQESKQESEEDSNESEDEDFDKSTSTDGTTAKVYSSTKADVSNGTTSVESGSQTVTVVLTIICLVGLVAIVVLVVYIYRRRKYIQIRLFFPVSMRKAANRQNESNIYANETQGNSLQDCNEDPAIYSHVMKRKSERKGSQSNPVTSDKTIATIVAHTTGPDVYAVANKPSKAPTTKSSALKTDRVGTKDIDNRGDCFTDQMYSLATHDDVSDIYANEPLVVPPNRSLAGAVSKTSSSQEDEGLTVIENDLYCH